jgi:hypothetical protein
VRRGATAERCYVGSADRRQFKRGYVFQLPRQTAVTYRHEPAGEGIAGAANAIVAPQSVGSYAMIVNVVGDTIASGTSLHVFDAARIAQRVESKVA